MSTAAVAKAIGQEQNLELLEQSDSEVAVFELIDRMGSGFIREGTEKLPEPDELEFPGHRTILTKSAFNKKTGVKDGKPVYKRVPIRYRSDSESILPEEQDKAGSMSNPNNDVIDFVNGRIVVAREGLNIGKFDFLRSDSRNTTNPNRIPGVNGIYKEIFPDKEDEVDNDSDFALGAAIGYLESLIIDRKDGMIIYDEYRLLALRRLHGIVADTNNSAVKGLMALAKLRPVEFLQKSRQFEEETSVNILHAESLGLIEFENNRVVYKNKNKVLITFSPKLKKEQKVQSLAGYFMSTQGASDYEIFLTELKTAKSKNI